MKLSVTDNGCGIPEENLDKIFDPFFTTKKSQEGSGMGLAVVNGIARKHQGAVNVYSEKEKGSTFNVFFPALDVDFQEMDEEDLDIPHGHEHIFIIDDEPALLKSLQQTLEKLEYKVSTQSSARRALEQFKMNPEKFDLILTDQTMPDLTGIELAEEIKKIKKDIPVILISGFNEKINDKELNKTGINQFLTKPVDTAKIAQSIRSVIDGSH